MKEVRDNCEIQNGVQNFCICLRNYVFNCVHFIIYLILDFVLLLYMTLCLWLQILTVWYILTSLFQVMNEMEGLPLKRRRSEVADVDIKKCIICQIETNESTSSNKEARLKVIEAAKIRNDVVARRLEQVDNEQFVYHVNNKCYK